MDIELDVNIDVDIDIDIDIDLDLGVVIIVDLHFFEKNTPHYPLLASNHHPRHIIHTMPLGFVSLISYITPSNALCTLVLVREWGLLSGLFPGPLFLFLGGHLVGGGAWFCPLTGYSK